MKQPPQKPEVPNVLFQYRPPELWALDNLSRRVLYFNSPANFNDPYDCDIGLGIERMMKTGFAAQGEQLSRLASDMLSSIEGMPEEDADRIPMEEIPAKLRNLFREQIRVACFSEHNDNLLMWSHYAGRGEGFCLEFQVKGKKFFAGKDARALIAPINYEEKILVVDGNKTWGGAITDLWIKYWAYKSVDWKYEDEWRMIASKDNIVGEKKYNKECLKAVYFGTQTTKCTKELVRFIVEKEYPHAELWEGELSKTEYKVEFNKQIR